jgi:hypothetical protein
LAQLDGTVESLIQIMEDAGFINPTPAKIMPTWRNMQIGEAHIAKLLDHFLSRNPY